MPTLDGYEICVGDEIYHLMYGVGTVSQWTDKLSIKFQTTTVSYHMSDDGEIIQLTRALYWSEPEIKAPPKTTNVIKYKWVYATPCKSATATEHYYATAQEVVHCMERDFGEDVVRCEPIKMTRVVADSVDDFD